MGTYNMVSDHGPKFDLLDIALSSMNILTI
jgi:hypothetical protein